MEYLLLVLANNGLIVFGNTLLYEQNLINFYTQQMSIVLNVYTTNFNFNLFGRWISPTWIKYKHLHIFNNFLWDFYALNLLRVIKAKTSSDSYF
jgi:hypothetical protein